MSRKYSAWASNPPYVNPDLAMMRLTTIMGNEQDQLRHIERVEAIPHMYMNVDAPPPPTATRTDARAIQPAMLSRQNSSYFAAPSALPSTTNVQTKIWPTEKSLKHSSVSEHASSTSKRHHKHKHHHHHHHHSDKHHRHHSRRHRAKSAESIRNRQHQALRSPSKVRVTHPQYIEQEQQQQQQQQQPMIVYREVANGEGYTVDPNGLATVPYGNEQETTFVDDQQAPMFVYRDAHVHPQQQASIMTDGISQQVFFNQDQDGILQQTDPFVCLPQQQQQQSSQIVYCTEPTHQDYLCTSNNNVMQQSIASPPPQQQYYCVDNTPTTIQPTIINQIPVFNPLSATQTAPPLQRATSMIIQQPQSQTFQIVQQPQQVQVLQQPQPLQIIQNPQTQPGQFIQIASATPQMIQTIQPQMIQAQPMLQTIQMPAQTVAATPQILYQRPYDPVVVPIQNQQMAFANPPLVALSQPSYAPSRIVPAAAAVQSQGPNMFRHALLRTVADRTGVPVSAPVSGGLQFMQPTVTAPLASTPNLLLAGGMQRSASLPIVPLTPGGLLIPFQPSQPPGLKPGPLPRAGGYPSNLRNFDDIRRLMDQRRAQLLQTLQQPPPSIRRVPSPPVLSAVPRSLIAPYSSGSIVPSGARSSGTPFPSLKPAPYAPPPSATRLPYSPPSFAASSAGSAISAPYRLFRP